LLKRPETEKKEKEYSHPTSGFLAVAWRLPVKLDGLVKSSCHNCLLQR
jgi:hypothetical protein